MHPMYQELFRIIELSIQQLDDREALAKVMTLAAEKLGKLQANTVRPRMIGPGLNLNEY